MNKPILCLDFDGTMHSYASGWQGAVIIPDPPVDGLYEFLQRASEHFELAVYSARSHQEGGIEAMKAWLYFWAPDWVTCGLLQGLQFPLEKPPAFLTIDDRALMFTGVWPDPDALLEFKPWYKNIVLK